jgi:hypothetical protein
MTILAQVVKLIGGKIIDSLADKHKIQTRSFSPTSHVVSMLFSHLSHSLSLNDVCDSLQNHHGSLSQIRNCTPPTRNGFSHANRTRNADMAEELFWVTYNELKLTDSGFFNGSRNYPGVPHRIQRMIYAFDSSTISLTANSIDWARHRRRKAAAKMHTGLNMQSFMPDFVIVKSAKDSDPKTAWELCSSLKDGEIAVFDKAYVDFLHLNHLHLKGISWVTRPKENMLYEVMGQQVIQSQAEECPSPEEVMGQHLRRSRKKRKYVRKKIRIISDQHIRLTGVKTPEHYPRELRLITAEVEVKNKMVNMSFIANNFIWSPYTVCELYRARWGIEVFFKELKQTLQLADFMGYNENAVRWQIWTALLAYLLLRYIAWKNHWKHAFSRLFTIIRGVLWNYFEMSSIIERCDTMGRRGSVRIRGSPEQAYQMSFEFV